MSLKIAGTIDRSFLFPTNVKNSMLFFADLGRLSTHLPYIDVAHHWGQSDYRMLYHARELGAYNIYIYADVAMMVSFEEQKILIMPANQYPPVPPKSTFNSAVGQGLYASQSLFFAEGEEVTRVEYHVELHATLPRPKGLRFMPATALDHIAQGIANHRLHETVNGFVENSIAAFPTWWQSQSCQCP